MSESFPVISVLLSCASHSEFERHLGPAFVPAGPRQKSTSWSYPCLLCSLKQLNLDQNGIKEVPYLHYGSNSHFSIHPLSAKSGIREGLRSRKSAGKRLRQNPSAGLDEQPDYIILPNNKDPDRSGESPLGANQWHHQSPRHPPGCASLLSPDHMHSLNY